MRWPEGRARRTFGKSKTFLLPVRMERRKFPTSSGTGLCGSGVRYGAMSFQDIFLLFFNLQKCQIYYIVYLWNLFEFNLYFFIPGIFSLSASPRPSHPYPPYICTYDKSDKLKKKNVFSFFSIFIFYFSPLSRMSWLTRSHYIISELYCYLCSSSTNLFDRPDCSSCLTVISAGTTSTALTSWRMFQWCCLPDDFGTTRLRMKGLNCRLFNGLQRREHNSTSCAFHRTLRKLFPYSQPLS